MSELVSDLFLDMDPLLWYSPNSNQFRGSPTPILKAMDILADAGIAEVFHYAPLHYLPFIARSNALKAKPILLAEGFAQDHFRSMSRLHDANRGFGHYLHLTTHAFPPILAAKLASGFPHIRLSMPSSALALQHFDLCRFNVAMTRQLRRGGKSGFPESPTNGRYYESMQIPVAREHRDKVALLARHASRGEMVEILIANQIRLPAQTRVDVFSDADYNLALRVVAAIPRGWPVSRAKPDSPYPRSDKFAGSVLEFIEQALDDPHWLGNGLEFDRLAATKGKK